MTGRRQGTQRARRMRGGRRGRLFPYLACFAAAKKIDHRGSETVRKGSLRAKRATAFLLTVSLSLWSIFWTTQLRRCRFCGLRVTSASSAFDALLRGDGPSARFVAHFRLFLKIMQIIRICKAARLALLSEALEECGRTVGDVCVPLQWRDGWASAARRRTGGVLGGGRPSRPRDAITVRQMRSHDERDPARPLAGPAGRRHGVIGFARSRGRRRCKAIPRCCSISTPC
jgi:hypothetical protein